MKKRLRALIVEDSENDALLLVRKLRNQGYDLEFERVDTPEGVETALDQHAWDIVISDYSMPHFTAPIALKIIKEKGLDLPFIIVSGTIGEETAVAAMKEGAHDYLMKDNLERLSPAIDRELREAVIRRERKRAEKDLRESEERYRTLVETMNEGLGIQDDQGTLIYVNNTLCEMMGYNREEVLGRPVPEFLDEENRKIFNDQQQQRMRGSKNSYELVWTRGDREKIYTIMSPQPLFDSDGAYHGSFAVVTDITALKRAEADLRKERDFSQTLMRAAPIFFVAIGADGKTLMMNRAMLQALDYTLAEVVNKDYLSTFVPEADRKNLSKIFENLVKQKESTLNENHIVSRDGRELLVEWRGIPILTPGGDFDFFFGAGVDVTERKKAEEEIRQKNEQLEAALKVKNEFISMISHELRTPLAPIIAYAEYMLEGPVKAPDEFVKPLNVIKRRAENLAVLIEDLLTLSRMDRGTIKIQIQPISIQKHILEIIDDFQQTEYKKAVEIRWQGESFNVKADHVRFHQVLQNLVENAIKYSGDSVEIVLNTQIREGTAFISVSDNGIGILKEHLSDIFNRFYQVEHVDTRTHGGTGLGLAIARELVEMMNGTISVESEFGKGSTFTVSFPLTDEPNNRENQLDRSETQTGVD